MNNASYSSENNADAQMISSLFHCISRQTSQFINQKSKPAFPLIRDPANQNLGYPSPPILQDQLHKSPPADPTQSCFSYAPDRTGRTTCRYYRFRMILKEPRNPRNSFLLSPLDTSIRIDPDTNINTPRTSQRSSHLVALTHCAGSTRRRNQKVRAIIRPSSPSLPQLPNTSFLPGH